jgi:replicative DNA helicase
VPIAELVDKHPEVVTMEGWGLTTQRASEVWCTGRKQVFRLVTATGRVIRATANHPFRSTAGWRSLEEVRPGDCIAISGETASPVRRLPVVASRARTPNVVLKELHVRTAVPQELSWDLVLSIDPEGVEDVYDMTVPGTHNFVANGIVVHNSIEQDSDLVMMLYRDEVYNPDSEARGEAELIISKHRNGPTGVVRLAFMSQYTKFASFAKGPR